MAAPVIANARMSSGSVYGNTLIYPPTGAAAGDILLNFPFTVSTTNDIGAGANAGTRIVEYDFSSYVTVACYWQRLTASIPSSCQYTNTAPGALKGGLSILIRGCIDTGTPFEWYQKEDGAADNATFSMTANVTTGPNRLLVAGYVMQYPNYFNNNCTYFSENFEDRNGYPTGQSVAAYEYVQASAGATPADSGTLDWHTRKIGVLFAFIPLPSGYANKVNGVASANIGKVNGVATANIDTVIGV